jgi:hypothetical protein
MNVPLTFVWNFVLLKITSMVLKRFDLDLCPYNLTQKVMCGLLLGIIHRNNDLKIKPFIYNAFCK